MWKYSLEKKLFSMKEIELDDIFEGSWNKNFGSDRING